MTILDNVLPKPEEPKKVQPGRFHIASPTNETNAIRTLGSMIAILMKQAGLEEVRFAEEALYDYRNHAISVQREFDRQIVIVRTI